MFFRTTHALGLVLATAVGLAAAPVPAPAPAEVITSKDWKFQVRFPSKPEEKSQEHEGLKIKLTIFSTTEKNGAYMVGVCDLPIPEKESDEMIETRLDGARDGAVGNIGAELTSSTPIQFNKKYPGREFTAKLPPPPKGPPEGIVKARIYLVGTRLYQTMVIGTTGFVTARTADAFLDSFKITE